MLMAFDSAAGVRSIPPILVLLLLLLLYRQMREKEMQESIV